MINWEEEEEEEEEEENDFSSIIGSSLRNVLENSVADIILPHTILSISHFSSWITLEKDFIQILKQHSTINHQYDQDLKLLTRFNPPRSKYEDYYFQSLLHSDRNFIKIKSDFDRLHQFMTFNINMK